MSAKRIRRTITCLDCRRKAPNAGRGRCPRCFLWHWRHGWKATREPLPTKCSDCDRHFGVKVKHQAHGKCTACYMYAYRQEKSNGVR